MFEMTEEERKRREENKRRDPYHNPSGGFELLDVTKYPYRYLDLAYQDQSEDQKLDIYLPVSREEALKMTKRMPLLVYVHGGGFEMGDRKYGHTIDLLGALDRGFAVAAISYRLSKEKVFPAQICDARNAIRYLRKHADEYGYDGDKIGIFGESAGGGIVSLLAMNPKEPVFDSEIPEDLQGVSADVQACVDWFGVVDMSVMFEQNAANNLRPAHFTKDNCPEARYLGESLNTVDPAWLAKSNPITYLNEKMCPMLIEHGTGDFQVPRQQSENLYDAIVEKYGRDKAEIFELRGAVHEDPRFCKPDNMAILWSFFERNLK